MEFRETTEAGGAAHSPAAVKHDAVVMLRDVGKIYRDGALEVPALRGVTIDIDRACFTMIVGRSGSGKTTLLNLIGALDLPDQGQVIIDGQSLQDMNERQLTEFRASKVGFVFQNFNLIPVLTAYENVEFGLLQGSTGRDERRQAVEEALAAVGLSRQAGQRPSQLSGGQRQRVAIVRAIVKRPAIILADEPTANLDLATGTEIIEVMQTIKATYQTSFIFSTHDQHLMRSADRIHELSDGRLVPSVREGAAC